METMIAIQNQRNMERDFLQHATCGNKARETLGTRTLVLSAESPFIREEILISTSRDTLEIGASDASNVEKAIPERTDFCGT
mmetsp:Transcript_35168/g.65150  ORF Transcript_35168/g.65150 Transcript_35168/m.65150 type:complete len:82 (-) Transcript_35168:1540-1785(-)